MTKYACPGSIVRHGAMSALGDCAAQRQPLLVVGYGNDLRCDDGAGVRAATLIAARSPRARVLVTAQLTADLADDVARAGRVVFVDAYVAKRGRARLRVERLPVDAAGSAPALAHHSDPAALIGLSRQLGGGPVDAWVLGIPGFCFDAGETISAATARWIDQAVALIVGGALRGRRREK